MSVTIGGAIILSLALLGVMNRQFAIVAFLLTLPMRSLIVVDFIGRPFRPSDILILVLGYHMMMVVAQRALDKKEVRVVISTPFIILIVFAFVCTLSVVYLFISTPDNVLVHPYNQATGLNAFQTRSLAFNRNNLTQLLMRFLVIGSIITIATTFDFRRIEQSIRWIIYGALITGVVGIIYQASIILDITEFAAVMRTIGFNRFPDSPANYGFLPRMYSLAGESGTVANLFLFALSLMLTSTLAVDSDSIFSKRLDLAFSFLFILLIIASTGTTGYGGLLILAAVAFTSVFLYECLSIIKYQKWAITSLFGGVVGVVTLQAVGIDVMSVIRLQIQKILFSEASGSLRAEYLIFELEQITARPLLGFGVGAHASTSVFGTILTDVGFIGLLIFVLVHVLILRECITKPIQIREKPIPAMLFVGGFTLFLTNFLSRDASSLVFGWYWLSLGLPLALHYHGMGDNIPSRDSA